MTSKEMVEKIQGESIKLTLEWGYNVTLRAKGRINAEQRAFIARYKDMIVIELMGEDATQEQHQKVFMSRGYSQELAGLIVWAWHNDDKWPIEPFGLTYTYAVGGADVTVTKNVENHKEFYMDIGKAIVDIDHDWVVNGMLLAYLRALKLLVEERG